MPAMMGTAGFSFKAARAMLGESGMMAMSEIKALYDEDFFAWSQQQAEALRAAAHGASNKPIDWENVAEEIESLGKSDRRELGSQIRRIIEHLVKLEHSPAVDPRPGWRASIVDARIQIEEILNDSPSLRREIPQLMRREIDRGARLAIANLEDRRELDSALKRDLRAKSYLELFSYNSEQILDDWFPPDPERPLDSAE
jgi:hypothetical protein